METCLSDMVRRQVLTLLLYYQDTMQAKAIKLMTSKLAVAGIVEGNLSEEGLAAISDVKDLTSQMAKELALGIRDNVEDIAAAFKKMAIVKPNQTSQRPAAIDSVSVETVGTPNIRITDAAEKQRIYEGLLLWTEKEQKKLVVSHNKCSESVNFKINERKSPVEE